MNKHEYDESYSRLEAYYATKANPARYELWWEKMRHLSASAFSRACDLWIEEGRYFPTLGQIKRMAWDNRTQAEISASQPEGHQFSEAERELGKDLQPLFLKYLEGKTSKKDWVAQMVYFSGKHGLETEMKLGIKEHLGPKCYEDTRKIPAMKRMP